MIFQCDIFASLKEVLFQMSLWRAPAPRTTDMSHMYSVKVPAGCGQSQLTQSTAPVMDNWRESPVRSHQANLQNNSNLETEYGTGLGNSHLQKERPKVRTPYQGSIGRWPWPKGPQKSPFSSKETTSPELGHLTSDVGPWGPDLSCFHLLALWHASASSCGVTMASPPGWWWSLSGLCAYRISHNSAHRSPQQMLVQIPILSLDTEKSENDKSPCLWEYIQAYDISGFIIVWAIVIHSLLYCPWRKLNLLG